MHAGKRRRDAHFPPWQPRENLNGRKAVEGISLPAGEGRQMRFHARHQYTGLAAHTRGKLAGGRAILERYVALPSIAWYCRALQELNGGRQARLPGERLRFSEWIIDQIRIIRNKIDDKNLSFPFQVWTPGCQAGVLHIALHIARNLSAVCLLASKPWTMMPVDTVAALSNYLAPLPLMCCFIELLTDSKQ